MAKLKKNEQEESIEAKEEVKVKSEKETLLELYQTLKDLKINSISDLENQINRA